MKYHHYIKDGLREELGIVNKNKRLINNAKGEILYILKANDERNSNRWYSN
jgi:hypothetical protein